MYSPLSNMFFWWLLDCPVKPVRFRCCAVEIWDRAENDIPYHTLTICREHRRASRCAAACLCFLNSRFEFTADWSEWSIWGDVPRPLPCRCAASCCLELLHALTPPNTQRTPVRNKLLLDGIINNAHNPCREETRTGLYFRPLMWSGAPRPSLVLIFCRPAQRTQLIWILHLYGRDKDAASMSTGLLRDEGFSRSADSWCSSHRTMVVCVSVLAALVLGIGILCALAAGPLHAQCAVEWFVTAIGQIVQIKHIIDK